jgi:hypothetical protein
MRSSLALRIHGAGTVVLHILRRKQRLRCPDRQLSRKLDAKAEDACTPLLCSELIRVV